MGSFLYMGIVSFDGNTFCQRLLFLIQDPAHCPEYAFLRNRTDKDFRKTVRNFTLVQFAIWVTIYVMSMEWAGVFVWLGVLDADKNYAWQAAGVVFPFLIAILVPIRERVLPAWFDQKAIDILDLTDTEAMERSVAASTTPTPKKAQQVAYNNRRRECAERHALHMHLVYPIQRHALHMHPIYPIL
jgi:hypothetical protein